MERKVGETFSIDNNTFIVKEVNANIHTHCSYCALRTVRCFNTKYLFAGSCCNRNDNKLIVFKIIRTTYNNKK